jgi:hypothetical protein
MSSNIGTYQEMVQGTNQACSKWLTQVTGAENFLSTSTMIEENKTS